MAYTPTVWATGDVITAEKLNKAENGIASAGAYIVEMSAWSAQGQTLYASYNDLAAHIDQLIIAQSEGDLGMTRMFLVGLSNSEGYSAFFSNGSDYLDFYAESADAETMVYEP